MTEEDRLRIGFTLRRLDGVVDVSVTRNTDPGLLGYSLLSGGQPVEFARDFPVCRAKPGSTDDIEGWQPFSQVSPPLSLPGGCTYQVQPQQCQSGR